MYEEVVQNRSVRKNILITEDLNSKLETVARDKKVSQNELVNKAISAYLKRFN